jgi:hypothetical protein
MYPHNGVGSVGGDDERTHDHSEGLSGESATSNVLYTAGDETNPILDGEDTMNHKHVTDSPTDTSCDVSKTPSTQAESLESPSQTFENTSSNAFVTNYASGANGADKPQYSQLSNYGLTDSLSTHEDTSLTSNGVLLNQNAGTVSTGNSPTENTVTGPSFKQRPILGISPAGSPSSSSSSSSTSDSGSDEDSVPHGVFKSPLDNVNSSFSTSAEDAESRKIPSKFFWPGNNEVTTFDDLSPLSATMPAQTPTLMPSDAPSDVPTMDYNALRSDLPSSLSMTGLEDLSGLDDVPVQ